MFDPLTLGIGAIGLGMQLFGKFSASEAAGQYSQLEQQNARLEQQINQQKKQQMELNSRRQVLENHRNAQRQRAMGVNAAVSQGATFGSGLLGGLYQNTAQAAFNDLGFSQNLQIGRNIFGLNDQVSGIKAQQAELKTDMNDAQGWASLGGSILSNANTIRNVGMSAYSSASNIGSGGFGPGSLFFGGGSPTGYGRG